MRISSITQNIYSSNFNNINVNKKATDSTNANNVLNNNSQVSFQGNYLSSYFISLFSKDPIKNFKHFTKDEFSKLTEAQKSKLRAEFRWLEDCHTYLYTSIGEMNAYAATCIQKVFDDRFGKNNYVVLPIGRSLSSICKSLSLKIGEENVVNIPMSNASRYFTENPVLSNYRNFINSLQKDSGLQTFLKFLELNNLSREQIETSGKAYILTDYCVSGFSLKGAEQLFKSDLVWGNRKNNIYAVDFMSLLDKFDDKTVCPKIENDPPVSSINKKIENILYESEYKDFSTVGSSTALVDTIDSLKIYDKPKNVERNTKLVWFNLIDTIMSHNGDFDVKLKKDFAQEDLLNPIAPGQKVEFWHNTKTQYKSDLRDDIIEILKIFLKVESDNSNKFDNVFKELMKDIEAVYNFLYACNYRGTNLENRFNYYQIRSDIKDMINGLNMILEDRIGK